MEKNNKKNNLPVDLDKIQLKEKLNDSFDLEKISVSEDLIERTLKAVRESQPGEEQTGEKKGNNEFFTRPLSDGGKRAQSEKIRKYKYQVRGMVGAAVAILILIVGYQVFSNNNIFMKQSNSQTKLTRNMDDTAKDINTGENAESSTYDIFSAVQPENGSSIEDSALNSDAAEPAGGDTKNSPDKAADKKEMNTLIPKEDQMLGILNTATFSQMYPITLNKVKSYKWKAKDGDSKTVTDIQNQLSGLIALLDETSFVSSEEASISDWAYETVIVMQNDDTYTIKFGEKVEITTNDDKNGKNTVVYQIEGKDKLSKKIKEYFNTLQ